MAFGRNNKNGYENERGSGMGTSVLMILIFLAFLAALMYILYTVTVKTIVMENQKGKLNSTGISIVIPQETETEEATETQITVEPEVTMEFDDLESLKTAIQESLAECEGTWSVYMCQLGEGVEDQSLLINNVVMPSASVMKIFIMGAVYNQINQGILVEKDVYEQMAEMIGASSNAAANALLKILGDGDYEDGIAVVNDFIADYGYDNGTHEYNGFENAETVFGGTNVVSALDCGLFLKDLYNNNVISWAYSQKMQELLSLQQTKDKIPALLPADTVVMNKTGEMDGTQNDVGIVLSPGADYCICILSSNGTGKQAAIEEIQLISKMVYVYFNSRTDNSR